MSGAFVEATGGSANRVDFFAGGVCEQETSKNKSRMGRVVFIFYWALLLWEPQVWKVVLALQALQAQVWAPLPVWLPEQQLVSLLEQELSMSSGNSLPK